MFERTAIHKAESKKSFYSEGSWRVLNKAALLECGLKNKDVKKGKVRPLMHEAAACNAALLLSLF